MREGQAPRKLRLGRSAVWCSDAAGTIRLINGAAAELLGISPESAIGAKCWEIAKLQSPDGTLHCHPQCAMRSRTARDGLTWQAQVKLGGRSGEPVDAELAAVLLSDALGRVTGVVHLLHPVERTGKATAAPTRWWGIAASGKPEDGLGAVRTDLLSTREHEILHLVALGASTHEAAERLFISPYTVRNHIRTIMKKLGVHSRLEAAAVWHATHHAPNQEAPGAD